MKKLNSWKEQATDFLKDNVPHYWKIKRILDIKGHYRNVRYGIANLYFFFNLVWNDRDYDWIFLAKLMRFKLSRMEHMIRNYGCHLHNERDADQIKRCVILLDRIIEDDYSDGIYKAHDEKWGKTDWDTMFEECEWDEDGDATMYQFKGKRPNVLTPEDAEQERKEYRRLMNKSEEARKRDIEYLFKYMNKHIQGWWD